MSVGSTGQSGSRQKVTIEINDQGIFIEPDHLAIQAGEQVQFVSNIPAELTFTGNIPMLVSGSGSNPFQVNESGLIFQIEDGGQSYPYEIHTTVETRSGHTSQGDLHPPD